MIKIYQDQGSVAETLTIPIDPSYPHIFVSVKYFTSDTYTTLASPASGTIAFSVKTNGSQGYIDFPDSPIDCTVLGATVSAGVCAESIIAIPSSIATATHYQVTVTASST